jgi:tetratricopeptide (TPR) repeat protein
VAGGSFQDAVRRRKAAGFVARADELTRFRANLALAVDDPDRRFIFCVHGDGGVGKTFLGHRLREIAESYGAVAAWTDDRRVFSVPEAMEELADDLSGQGVDMGGFTKLLGTYLQRRHELEADPDAPAGAASFVTRAAVRVGLHAAHAVPGVGGLAESVDPNALAEQADRLRLFLGKKFNRHEDVRMLLSPLDALTPAFAADLQRAARHRPLVLFFDTYEQTGPLLDGWLRSLLDGDYGDLPEDLLVTIAGRDPLSDNWSEYEPVLADVPLAPFTEDEARLFLTSKGVTDEQVVQVILTVSGRLPLLLVTLAETQPTDPGQVGDPSGGAVQRFLRWEADPARRALAVAAAVPRAINEDVLGVLITDRRSADDAKRGQLFDWLRSLAFVDNDGGRCVYHEVVRSAMLRLERSQSPVRWRERHRALAAAYQEWRAEISAENSWGDAEWRARKIEETYHRLCADPGKALPGALSEIVYALGNSVSNAAQWAQMISQAGGDTCVEDVRTWGQRLEESLRVRQHEASVACVNLLLSDSTIAREATSEALGIRGGALHALGRIDDALADFDAAISLAPADKRGHASRGEAFRQLGRVDEAFADFSRALELDAEYGFVLSRRGEIYRVTGRREDALIDFNSALQLNSQDAWALASRGATYVDMGRYDDALSDLDHALQLNPDYAFALASKGITCALVGRYDAALSNLDRAIHLDPGYVWAIASRVVTYGLVDRYQEALPDLKQLIELDPGNVWALTSRGITYGMLGRYDDALSDLDHALQLNPDYAFALSRRGATYRLVGRYDDALSDLDRAIQLNPEDAWALASRSATYSDIGHYDDALSDLNHVVQLIPLDAWPIAWRGATYGLMGRYDDALADLDRAVEIGPKYDLAVAGRGHILRRIGRYQEALADSDHAIELATKDYRCHYDRALSLIGLGETASGVRAFERAAELARSAILMTEANGSDFYNLAIYQAALGQHEAARDSLAIALERFPHTGLIRKASYDLRDLSTMPGMDGVEMAGHIAVLDATLSSLRLPRELDCHSRAVRGYAQNARLFARRRGADINQTGAYNGGYLRGWRRRHQRKAEGLQVLRGPELRRVGSEARGSVRGGAGCSHLRV